jgi:hypothetical protein
MKDVVFWDVASCGSCKNRRFEGTDRSVFQLVVTGNVASSLLILFTMMMDAICSSETSVLTNATRRHIQNDGILHSHRHENLQSYNVRNFRPNHGKLRIIQKKKPRGP